MYALGIKSAFVFKFSYIIQLYMYNILHKWGKQSKQISENEWKQIK